jgi:hypothetical protein
MNTLTPKDTCSLGILHINPPFIPSVDPRYPRVVRIEYLQTSGVTLDGEVVMVGDGEGKVVVEDWKSWLICAQNLLELMEYDLKANNHAPRGARQLRRSDVPGAQKFLGEFR